MYTYIFLKINTYVLEGYCDLSNREQVDDVWLIPRQ